MAELITNLSYFKKIKIIIILNKITFKSKKRNNMKSQPNVSKVTFVEANESYSFLKNKNLFAEKHARAKEILKGMKLPDGIIGK